METLRYVLRHPITAVKEFLRGFIDPDDCSAEAEQEEKLLQILKFAIGFYKETLGRFPEELKDLCFNTQEDENWNGPFIEWKGEDTFKDSFGYPYLYHVEEKSFKLESVGLNEWKKTLEAEQDTPLNSRQRRS